MTIKLNDGQVEAKNRIIEFVNDKNTDDYAITLSGYAGTGKTTLMNDVIKELKRNKKIVVSAPTHKAKEKIAEITNQNAETIQALLGLRPNLDLTDFDPNKPIFEVKADERIQYYNVLVIDEASMLSQVLVDLIEEKARQNRVKVIYMGDIYQLPPVKEKISQVFNLSNLVQLTEIVRQSGSNPNQQLIELARNDVRDGTDTFTHFIRENKMNMTEEPLEGYKVFEQDDYYNSLLPYYYDSEYKQNPNLMKTLAWTNKAVSAINAFIRKNVINSDEMIAVGDILMGYKSITKESNTPPYYIPIVKNSVDYIVTKVELEEVLIMGVTLKGYRTTVQDGYLPMFILHRDSYADFVEEYNDRLQKAKTYRQWKPFYNFKEKVVLLEPVKDAYGNHVCDKDIDYGYAVTVHKSQGSTYDHVGITLPDIMKNSIAKERRQLIYVAISRTAKTNNIYGK